MTEVYSDDEFAKFCSKLSSSKNEELIKTIKVFNARFLEIFKTDYYEKKTSCKAFSLPRLFFEEIIFDNLHHYIDSWLQFLGKKEDEDVEDYFLPHASIVVQFLTILCRSPNNLQIVHNSNISDKLLQACSIVSILKFCPVAEQVAFLTNVTYLLECLYDPFLRGRCSLLKNKKSIENDPSFVPSRPVHNNVKVFIIEMMRMTPHGNLAGFNFYKLTSSVASLFVAVILGDSENASHMICPATIDTIFEVLLSAHYDQYPLFCNSISSVILALSSILPEKRQLEMSMVVDRFWEAVLTAKKNDYVHLMGLLIDEMTFTVEEGKKDVQQLFVDCQSFKKLYSVLEKTSKWNEEVTMAFLRLVASLLKGNNSAQMMLEKEAGYPKLFGALTSCCGPSKDIWRHLLCIIVEIPLQDYKKEVEKEESKNLKIQNTHILLYLLNNLRSLSDNDFKQWLTATLSNICLSSWENKVVCIQSGVIDRIICVLLEVPKDDKVIDDMFEMFENLASVSLTSDELKKLMRFFDFEKHSQMHPKFRKKLLRSLIQIASSKNKQFQITFWDFSTSNSCLTVDNDFVLTPNGFTLHAWIKFNTAKQYKNYFHCFSMKTVSGNKLDVFFDERCSLTILLGQQSFTVEDVPMNDGSWHCISICHSAQRGLFGHRQLNVYVDGVVHFSLDANFPFYSESITECHMGYSSNRTPHLHKAMSLESSDLDINLNSSSSKISPATPTQPRSLGFLRFFKTPNRGTKTQVPQKKEMNKTFDLPAHLVPLVGCIAEVMILNEALSASQVESLYKAGLNPQQRSCTDNEEFISLCSKATLWYTAKASSENICYDLSKSSNNGHVLAKRCSFTSIKNLLNSVGGIQAFLAIMDQASQYDHREISMYGFGLKEYIDLLLLLITDHPMNLESFMKCDGMAILGLYLRNVDTGFIDLNLLESLKSFFSLVSVHPALQMQMLDSIFFNFRIWKRASANVLYALVEILKKIAEDKRDLCRKKYGVQFLLDVYSAYFSKREDSSTNDNCDNYFLTDVRKSLCTLIKIYISNGMTSDELWQIMDAFCHSSEAMSSELAQLIVDIFESANKSDQVYLFMCNVKLANLLYAFLASDAHSVEFKECIIKILDRLLRSNKINESYKSLLRILESEYCQGFIRLLSNSPVSDGIVEWFINQLFLPENPNVNSFIHVIRLCAAVATLNVRTKFMQKLVHVLHNKPSLAKSFNAIPGWPHELLKLLVIPKSSRSASDGSPMIETNQSIATKESPTFDKLFKESKVLNDAFDPSLFDDPWSSMKVGASRQGSINSQTSTPTSLGSSMEMPDLKLIPLSVYCSYMHLSPAEVNLPKVDGDDDSDKEILVYFILFLICDLAWRNSDDATVDEKAWKIREDTIVAMEEIQNTKGLITQTNLAIKFFEMVLLICAKDLTQLPTSSKQNIIKNSLRIVKHLYCFMNANKTILNFTEGLLLSFTHLMDEILPQQSELQSSFDLFEVTFLLTYISQEQHKMKAITRLHEMISLRPALQFYQRVCFVLDNLNKAMSGSEIPDAMKSLMETFLDRCYDLLNLERELPDVVRPTNGKHPLRIYQFSRKWEDFISKVVEPSSAQEKANMLDSVEKVIVDIKGQRCEDLVVNMTRRNREEYESELKFKANHLALLQKIDGEEKMRLKVLEVHDETKEALITIKWKQAKKIFHCERGFWPTKNKKPTLLMIAPCENYMKMRPKLMEVDQERIAAGKVNGKMEKQRSLLNVFDELKKYGGMKNPVDQLTDEEWEKLKSSIDLSEAKGDRKASVRMTYQECELVTIFDSIQGELELSPSLLTFKKAYHNAASSLASLMLPAVDTIKMPLENLKEIHFRKFNLQRTGLELFFINQCSCFLNFKNTNIRNKVFSDIVKILPREVMKNMARSPKDFLRTSEITQKWVQREISNFEYLMQLNSVSGRTYNDLSQYPVFPWILSDYTSPTLNLDDPNIYRDFSWPVGALNPNNREFLREKFSNLKDASSDRKDWFHYGTHYSNPAGVMLYLLRLEPFTTLHKQLHGGTFDLTDRQFNGLPSTWNNLLNNSNDVKELIPEFFYLPEFLRNVNGLEMTKMQGSDELFDDVKLPVWANSPSAFIHKHMDALESDHVSANLNKWIDLIFGFKQKGDEAIESLNVFHYYTYEDSLDPNEIPVGNLRKGYEDFVKNFGQTPSQLFTIPHPKRLTTHEWLNQTGKLERVLNFFDCPKISKITTLQAVPPGIADNLVYISSYENNLLVLTSNGLIGIHSWQNYDKATGNQFNLTLDNTMDNHKNQKKLVSSFCLLEKMTYRLFAMIPKTKLFVSGGHWDNSLRVHNIYKFKLEAYVTCHTDIITCVAVDRHGRKLATGSKDGSCLIWDISHKDSKVESLAPTRALCGHAGKVTSIALSCELNVVASSSEDGSIIIYNLDDGSFSRCVRPPRGRDWKVSVKDMAMSDLGYLCVYVVRTHTATSNAEPDEHMLHMYNINGRHISMTELESPVTAILMCERHALVGFKSGEFAIRKLFSVDAELSETFQSPVACISATEGNGHIIVGLEDSTLKVFQVKTK